MRETDPLRRAITGGLRGVLIEIAVVMTFVVVTVLASAVITSLA